MRRLINLIGRRFGRLTVVSRAENAPCGKARWNCLCDCGKENKEYDGNLKRGGVKSCGCLKKEIGIRCYKHGKTSTRLYNIWRGMRKRTYCQNQKDYEGYGGRGIAVCDEWKNNYEAFEKWALQSGYTNNLTIERINNDGDYTPENCRWATVEEQGNNKRNNHYITYNGEIKTVTEWSRIFGIKKATVYNRILTLGWDEIKAIVTPVKKR